MTDQIPAGLTSDEAQAVREWAERARGAEVQDETVAHAARVLLAVLPKHPTLADMTEEERRECRWLQCDYGEPGRAPRSRGVIGYFDHEERRAVILTTTCGILRRDYANVTPRPDLPRLEWPGNQKPAPALPAGWRLADHPAYGRVIVTTRPSNRNGYIYAVIPADDPMGYDWIFCTDDELTYLDTPEAVPPNTLAVGSVWIGVDALTRACEESGRDQIVVSDFGGYVSVWSHDAEWWEGSTPPRTAPYTIIHTGREAADATD